MLLQLIQASDLARGLSAGAHDSFDGAFRTVRNFVARMRESIQRDRANPEWRGHAPRRIQIRFVGGT